MTNIPSFDLNGKKALVTGAARGLGKAIAEALANAGADVVLGVRDLQSGADVKAQIEAMGRKAHCVLIDVLNLEDSVAAFQKISDQLDGIDILVNNAGGGIPHRSALDVSMHDFDSVINHNVKSVYFLSQCFAADLIKRQKKGKVINLSSQAAISVLPGESVYCLSKAAVSHMTRCMAIEWGEHGINVNAIAPTFIETPGTAPALSDAAFKAEVINNIAALHRIGKPADVAGAAVFLASSASDMMTGHNLVIDGGWTLV